MILRCPKGYRFHVVSTVAESSGYVSNVLPKDQTQTYRIELRTSFDNEMIGYVDVAQTVFGFWETHAYLDSPYRGNGLGTLMYAKAIDTMLKLDNDIRSSATPSSNAEGVWRSKRLREHFIIKRKAGRFHALSRKT